MTESSLSSCLIAQRMLSHWDKTTGHLSASKQCPGFGKHMVSQPTQYMAYRTVSSMCHDCFSLTELVTALCVERKEHEHIIGKKRFNYYVKKCGGCWLCTMASCLVGHTELTVYFWVTRGSGRWSCIHMSPGFTEAWLPILDLSGRLFNPCNLLLLCFYFNTICFFEFQTYLHWAVRFIWEATQKDVDMKWREDQVHMILIVKQITIVSVSGQWYNAQCTEWYITIVNQRHWYIMAAHWWKGLIYHTPRM
jgi:hypothetical protein